MRSAPNQTVLLARVLSVRDEPDGFGATIQVEVLKNESKEAAADFLRPQPGAVLELFTADPPPTRSGTVRIQAALLAGPNGQRAVARDIAATD